MHIELDVISRILNGMTPEVKTIAVLETKEAAEEYNRINRASNKLGDTVITYKLSEFEPREI